MWPIRSKCVEATRTRRYAQDRQEKGCMSMVERNQEVFKIWFQVHNYARMSRLTICTASPSLLFNI